MRRELSACLVLGLAGGDMVLFGAGEPWETAAASVPTVPGGDVNPVGSLVSSLGAVVLLGTVVVAVTRTVGRRLAGAVVVLCAVATAYVTVTAAGDWSGWRLLVLLGAALGVVSGALAAWRGSSWSGMSRRYDAPSQPPPEHESDPWRALDRGEDPTL